VQHLVYGRSPQCQRLFRSSVCYLLKLFAAGAIKRFRGRRIISQEIDVRAAVFCRYDGAKRVSVGQQGKAVSIWLDVTTTLGWKRPALGIVRVEAETARYFLETHRSDVRFCGFNRTRRAYFEVTADEFNVALARVEAGGSRSVRRIVPKLAWSRFKATPGLRSTGRKRRENRILTLFPRQLLNRVFSFMAKGADEVRRYIRAFQEARTAFSIARRGHRASGRPVETVRFLSASSRETCGSPFRPGDVYVSMGLDWLQKDLGCLFELKLRPA